MAKRNFGKADCPIEGCKSSPVTLTAEGVLRMHGPRDNRCAGSGQKPAETGGELARTLAELDSADWANHRETEIEEALNALGGPPGHITTQWAEQALLANGKENGPGQDEYARAVWVLMAGSLDKLSINARVALQEIRSTWYSEAPEDPAVVAQRGPNPYREPVPTKGPGQLEMGQEREAAVSTTSPLTAATQTGAGVRALFADVRGVNVHLDNSAATLTPTSTVPLFIAAPEPTTVPGLAPGAPLPVRVGPDEKTDFDQWKRYKIPDPITGKVTGRQRVTTFAKSISDQYGLGQWQQRVLLTGAARFPAMAAGAENLDVKADREVLDQMVESIKNAAGANDKAAHGTTVHTYTEHMDAGSMTADAWIQIPQEFLPDLMAYRNEMSAAGLYSVPEMIERTTIHRGLEVAGTLDRILLTPDGEYVIGDVKTGQDLSYGWLDIAIQLACYAHGVNENGVWDWAERVWMSAPKVRTDYAIVMHAPAGQGTCTLYRVDLTKGWAAATLAKQVVETRKTRKGKDIAQIWAGPSVISEAYGLDALEAGPSVAELAQADSDRYAVTAYGFQPPAALAAQYAAPAMGGPVMAESWKAPEGEGRPIPEPLEDDGPTGAGGYTAPYNPPAPVGPASNGAPAFHVQPPTLPGLEPSARPAADPFDQLREYARDAMKAAFLRNEGEQSAVYATAQQTFPAGDRIFDELIQIGNGEPPF